MNTKKLQYQHTITTLILDVSLMCLAQVLHVFRSTTPFSLGHSGPKPPASAPKNNIARPVRFSENYISKPRKDDL